MAIMIIEARQVTNRQYLDEQGEFQNMLRHIKEVPVPFLICINKADQVCNSFI